MLYFLVVIFTLGALSLVFFQRLYLFYLGRVKPVYLRSLQAHWDRDSSLLDKPLSLDTFEMKSLGLVHYLIIRSKNKLILLASPSYLKKLELNPVSEVSKFLEFKCFDFTHSLFHVCWIFVFLKEDLFARIQKIQPKVVSLLLMFLLIPLDSLLNFLWFKFSKRNEFNSTYWNKKSDLWVRLVS